MKNKPKWRTPSAGDGSHGGPNARDSGGALHLSAQVNYEREREREQRKTFSTPRTSDAFSAAKKRVAASFGQNDKRHQLREEVYDSADSMVDGKLNPQWVCLLMGWPKHWTQLDDEAEQWFKPTRAKGGKSVVKPPKKPQAQKTTADSLSRSPWADGWEDGTPRVVASMPHRSSQLRCTGNGVVSLQSVPAWSRLQQILKETR